MVVISLEMAMSEPVRHLLELFDALPEPDKRWVLVEFLRRGTPDSGDVSATTFDSLADELFGVLDSEEIGMSTKR